MSYVTYDSARSPWERLDVDFSDEFDRGVRKQSIGREKPPVISVIVEEDDASSLEVNANVDPYHNAYPKWLVNVFSVGLMVAVIGVAILMVTAFVRISLAEMMGGVLTSVGTVMIALSVLRGQDLGRNA